MLKQEIYQKASDVFGVSVGVANVMTFKNLEEELFVVNLNSFESSSIISFLICFLLLCFSIIFEFVLILIIFSGLIILESSCEEFHSSALLIL